MIKVVVGVLNYDKQYLVVKRAEGERAWPGYWCFPGGKVEGGEYQTQALDRELKEELGTEHLGIIGDCLHLYEREHLFFVSMIFVNKVPEITLNHEHTEYKWVSYKELKTLEPTNNTMDGIIALIGHYLEKV